mgnify:CR=1 FL=1
MKNVSDDGGGVSGVMITRTSSEMSVPILLRLLSLFLETEMACCLD